MTFVSGGNEEIREIERVGNYALSLTWGDGHSTGIYTWRHLRALCQCATCRPESDFVMPEEATP